MSQLTLKNYPSHLREQSVQFKDASALESNSKATKEIFAALSTFSENIADELEILFEQEGLVTFYNED
jgi:hypothetical protein